MLSPCAIQFLSIQIVIIYFFPSREFILRYLTISDKNNCDRKPVAIKENIKWVRIERVEFRIITNDKQGMKEEGYFKERDRPRVRESERERQSIWIWIFKFWNSNWLQNKKKNEERAKNVKKKIPVFLLFTDWLTEHYGPKSPSVPNDRVLTISACALLIPPTTQMTAFSWQFFVPYDWALSIKINPNDCHHHPASCYYG